MESWEWIRLRLMAASCARDVLAARSCWRRKKFSILQNFYRYSSRCFEVERIERKTCYSPDIIGLRRDFLVVILVGQIFALKDWHKLARQLVGRHEWRESVVGHRDGFWCHVRLVALEWLVLVAVVAGLHLRLHLRVGFVRIGSGFVDESGLNSGTLHVFRRAAVQVGDAGDLLRWLLLAQHHTRMLKWQMSSVNAQLSCTLLNFSYHRKKLGPVIIVAMRLVVVRRVRNQSANAIVDLRFAFDCLVCLMRSGLGGCNWYLAGSHCYSIGNLMSCKRYQLITKDADVGLKINFSLFNYLELAIYWWRSGASIVVSWRRSRLWLFWQCCENLAIILNIFFGF